MKSIASFRVLIPALFLLLAPLAMTASAAENTGAKDKASSHGSGDHADHAEHAEDHAEGHGEEESGGPPIGFLILIVLVGVLAVAPAYHRLNVGEGESDHSDAGAH
jgi:hypothetical protein